MVERQKVLVAYDLGLGKTVLTIAAIEALREKQPLGGVLVVCLSSLKYQWAKEIEKFSDQRAIVIDGTPKQRAAQWNSLSEYDYVIVNYEQVVNDWDALTLWEFGVLVMDEATAIKGFRSKRSKKVKELAKDVSIRFGLTGTPIENGKPEELYSIMQAVDSRLLGPRFDLFDQTFIVRDAFGRPTRYRNLDKLHARLKTASVRKSQTDPDVAPYLPDTIEKEPILVPLERHSAIVYRRVVSDLKEELAEVGARLGSGFNLDAHYGHGSGDYGDTMRGRIMAKVTALRMLCDDPLLLRRSAEIYDPFAATGSEYATSLLEDPFMASALDKARGTKVPVLAGLVTDHFETSEEAKVVVFTSYVEMAHKIRDTLGGEVYTGQMSAKEKEAAKVRFQTDPSARLLISTDAGGYGVDLPQANLLINFDLPWSSGLAIQRNGRIRRASSKWPSIVIQDLLASDTLEERQHAMLSQKRSIATAVLDGRGINEQGGVDLTVGALSEFLREVQP